METSAFHYKKYSKISYHRHLFALIALYSPWIFLLWIRQYDHCNSHNCNILIEDCKILWRDHFYCTFRKCATRLAPDGYLLGNSLFSTAFGRVPPQSSCHFPPLQVKLGTLATIPWDIWAEDEEISSASAIPAACGLFVVMPMLLGAWFWSLLFSHDFLPLLICHPLVTLVKWLLVICFVARVD